MIIFFVLWTLLLGITPTLGQADCQWVRSYGTEAPDSPVVAANAPGTFVAVTHGTIPPKTTLYRLSSSGEPVWSKTTEGTVTDIALLPTSVWVTGVFAGATTAFGTSTFTASSSDVFVSQLDYTGLALTRHQLGGASPDVNPRIAVSQGSSPVVAWNFASSTKCGAQTFTSRGGSDLVFATLLPSLHCYHIGDVYDDELAGLASHAGAVAVAISFTGKTSLSTAVSGAAPITSAGLYDSVVGLYEPSDLGGVLMLERTQSVKGAGYELIEDLAMDGSRIVAVGNFGFAGSTATVGPHTLQTKGSGDAFIFVWNTASDTISAAKNFGGLGDDYFRSVSLSGSLAAVAGDWSATADFGSGPVTSNGRDGILSVYNSDTLAATAVVPIGSVGGDKLLSVALDTGVVTVGGFYSWKPKVGSCAELFPPVGVADALVSQLNVTSPPGASPPPSTATQVIATAVPTVIPPTPTPSAVPPTSMPATPTATPLEIEIVVPKGFSVSWRTREPTP